MDFDFRVIFTIAKFNYFLAAELPNEECRLWDDYYHLSHPPYTYLIDTLISYAECVYQWEGHGLVPSGPSLVVLPWSHGTALQRPLTMWNVPGMSLMLGLPRSVTWCLGSKFKIFKSQNSVYLLRDMLYFIILGLYHISNAKKLRGYAFNAKILAIVEDNWNGLHLFSCSDQFCGELTPLQLTIYYKNKKPKENCQITL